MEGVLSTVSKVRLLYSQESPSVLSPYIGKQIAAINNSYTAFDERWQAISALITTSIQPLAPADCKKLQDCIISELDRQQTYISKSVPIEPEPTKTLYHLLEASKETRALKPIADKVNECFLFGLRHLAAYAKSETLQDGDRQKAVALLKDIQTKQREAAINLINAAMQAGEDLGPLNHQSAELERNSQIFRSKDRTRIQKCLDKLFWCCREPQ